MVAPAASPRLSAGSWLQPKVLFPAAGMLMLALIWGGTLNVIVLERAAADAAARVSSRELVETYEAHVLRALREIDQTLKVVQFAYEGADGINALEALRRRDLLPPALLFEIRLIDAAGNELARNPPVATGEPARNLLAQRYFSAQRDADHLAISLPQRAPGQAWKLVFSRRLNDRDGGFAGAVLLTVDAAFFVSAYEPQKLGARGTLALIGDDGVFRARRAGEVIAAGEQTDFAALMAPIDASDTASSLMANPWDGVRRYTSVRQLYGYPLAVLIGLAADEQLAASERSARQWLAIAVALSIGLGIVLLVLARMNHRLVEARRREADAKLAMAREAGMAEIATHVLHNVGNVLNSVNVSTALIGDRLRASKSVGLQRTVQLLAEHRDDLGAFLSRDERGRLLPAYLEKLAETLADEQRELLIEVEQLAGSIEHLKQIVAAQQSLAGSAKVLEAVAPQDLIDEAVRLVSADLHRLGIRVERSVQPAAPVLLDRHRLLSVLVNLLANARDAIVAQREHGKAAGTIRIDARVEGQRLRVKIGDDGEGIPSEALTRIFGQGFSTRRQGRGFGLHSCALTAAEFGGTLAAHSAGPGRGAEFTLDLPVGSA